VRVQGEVVNIPVPLEVNPTVPVGVRGEPRGDVSTTVTVQLMMVLTGTSKGAQVTLVEVILAFTVIVTELLVLPLCPPSPW
jgi:hypothetical protein